MTNLERILKSRDHPLPRKVHLVKTIFFSSTHVWMWELDHKESWALKDDAFELWCWRELLRAPWTARRLSQSILKVTNPEYLLERLMLKLQYFGHLMQRADSLEKTLMLGTTEGRRRRGGQRMRRLDGITDSMDMNFEQTPRDGEEQGSLTCYSPWGRKESTWLSDWTTTMCPLKTKQYSKPGQEYCILIKERTSDLCKTAVDHRRNNTN